MTNIIARGIVATALVFAALPVEAQLRIETTNFSNLMAPVTRAYVAPGKTKEYYIYGKWVELATKVTLNNVQQTIVGRQPFATSTEGLLRVNLTVPSGTARGIQAAIIHIACPYMLPGCAPALPFPVQVLSVGTLGDINPKMGVAVNSPADFTITGTTLGDATVFLFRTDLKGITNINNASGSLSFRGYTASCGTNRVRVRDVAEGGDFYPFPGGLDIDLATDCGVRIGGTPSTGGGGTTAGVPELQPIIGAPVFRHIAANRKVSNSFCQGMFAQAVTAIVKTITVGDLVWGVKNAGAATTTPFRIRLLRGGVQVAEQNLANGLKAGEDTTFTFDRGTQAQTEVARLGLVPPAASQQIYNATGGECVQTVGQATQFDWQDAQWEIRVDPAQAVTTETNRSNNNKTF